MTIFDDCCDNASALLGAHHLRVLSARPEDLAGATATIAAIVPGHYSSEEHVARQLERLGKPAAAAFIREKLPTNKAIRSGDLGEILAAEYIEAETPFSVPIRRLRWKDHRNMAMRGDDLIGLLSDPDSEELSFLKGEAKSRINLAAGVVAEARAALQKDDGLPSPHALSFVSERLFEEGALDLADAIDNAQLKDGIVPGQVSHLLFTFSGNDPTNHLQGDLAGYAGPIAQYGVGLRVVAHATFVRDVYESVMAHGNDD